MVDLGGQRGLEVLVDAGLVEQLVLDAAARGVRARLGEVAWSAPSAAPWAR